jgi:hypothetical protein
MQSVSIHVGLDHVDPQRYAGWRGDSSTCEADAQAMAALAAAQGITRRTLLLASEATHARVKAELEAAAAVLRRGDYLLLTFAGHGTWFDDIPMPGVAPAAGSTLRVSHPGDEDDRRDEAWCLYDTYILDDELHDCFCRFAPGVRICVVSDSCFSGTVTRGKPALGSASAQRSGLAWSDEPAMRRERRMHPRLANALYRRDFLTVYRPRSLAASGSRMTDPGAHVVLLAACEDDQAALEGRGHGLFTEKLLGIWNDGRYAGSHPEFIAQIKAAMPRCQQPCVFVCGAPDPEFVAGRPFTWDR